MDPDTVAFVGVAIVVSVVPGPDMALVARNTLLGGRGIGTATVVGVGAGILTWSVLAAAGVAAMLAASAVAFTAVKLVGAGYLVYLGVATIRAGAAHHVGAPGRVPMAPRTAAAQGFLSAALNPKLGVLFLTLLPQFTGPAASTLRFLELALIFAGIGVSWLLTYTWLIDSISRVLSRPRPQRALRWVTGGALIGLGARLAVERS